MELVQALWCPKEGSTDAQYEDAFQLGEGGGVACVADGASAAVYARQWANLLVAEFATGDPVPDRDDPLWSRVSALGKRWSEEVGGSGEENTSWWAEEKLPEGSQASLLVVRWDENKLHAASVGDVCLFVIRDNKFKWAFPLKKSAAFGNHPALIPTDPTKFKKKPPVVRFSASLEPKDRLFLCTDAIAQWFLWRYEQKARPWDELPAEEELRAWVQARRDDDSLKNDDVTLLELHAL
jgi:hypothetical protein